MFKWKVNYANEKCIDVERKPTLDIDFIGNFRNIDKL